MPDPRAASVAITVDAGAVGAAPIRVQAYVPTQDAPRPGDLVRIEGRWAQPKPEGWALHLARRGIHGLFLATSCTVLAPGPGGPIAWAVRLRGSALGALERVLPDEGYRLMGALLLGARGLLPDRHADAFREAGVAHLLALSGLHVGLLAAGLWWLLGRFRLRITWRYLLLIPLVALYVLVGGARLSLIRAAAMFGVLGVFAVLWDRGWVVRNWYEPLNALACVAVGVLVAWPWTVLDVGFQLSFAATGSILVFLPAWLRSPVRSGLPWLLRRPADLLAVTLCAQVGAVPIIGAAFGYIAPYGLLANLVLVPWTGVLLWGGLTLFPLGAVLGTAYGGWVHAVLIGPYVTVVETVGGLPGSVLPVAPDFGLWYLCAMLALLLLRAVSAELQTQSFLDHRIQHG